LAGAPLSAAEFDRPSGLEPDIGFWRTVFAEISTRQALVHDNRNLGIVYEVITMPDNSGPRRQRKISENARDKYRRILKTLAGGKRNGLTSEESRVLALWPAGTTNAELRDASQQVRFQQGLSDRFRAGLIRSGRWRGHIIEALAREQVPIGLAALPHVESSFNPEAHSHVGASGLWQFTRSTGRRFMRIDHVVDERRDPYISSDSAARLLAYNYSILNSWPLAITAYNHGVAGMRRAVKKVGTDDIETILRSYNGRSFGFASRNFYVAFLAAYEVESNHEKYFGPVHKDSPRPEIVVELPDYFAADTLTSAFGLSGNTLKSYNPALLDSVWSGTKHVPRGYLLRLPALEVSPPRVLAAIPDGRRFAEQTPDTYHKVRRGENLSAIARRYSTNVSELVALNGLESRHRIRVGQVLRLPYRGGVPASSPISGDEATYTVMRGDTVGGIARRAGMTTRELLTLNSIRNRNKIFPGQKLLLKSPPVVASEPEPAPALVSQAEISEPVVDLQATTPAPVVENESTQELVLLDNPTEAADSAVSQSEAVAVDTESDSASLADPSDYLVAENGTIEVQAEETLGHYADWLEIKTQRLRDYNGLAFRKPVVIGTRLNLKFDRVGREEFTARRIAYHRELQESFFEQYRIKDTMEHKLRRGESVWELAYRRYKVPVWLLRQYNPELNFDRVRPGARIVFPQIEVAESREREAPAMADAS
jgi:membrane-bound lytic murein transglycosylase D